MPATGGTFQLDQDKFDDGQFAMFAYEVFDREQAFVSAIIAGCESDPARRQANRVKQSSTNR